MKKLLIYISFLFLLACQPNELEVVKMDIPAVSMIVPSNYVTAGNSISIQIVNEESWKGSFQLYLKSALSVHHFDLMISKKVTSVDIDGNYIEDAGIYECLLVAGNQIKDKKNFLVKAHDIEDPIELFTGPNSIWVNDLQETMVVALPKDKYGNAGREGDSLNFQFRNTNNENKDQFVRIVDQVAYQKISSGVESGKIFAGVSSQEKSGKEQRMDAIQLWPEEIEIELVEHLPYADSRQFYRLKTAVLKDVNGDVIPDGTHVRFSAMFKRRKLTYNAYSIDGVANVYIKNPEFPSEWILQADVGSGIIMSNELRIAFESNVKDVPVLFKNDQILVGPITSYIGQYISDGTKVYFLNGGEVISSETEDGIVRFKQPVNLKDPKIRVAGRSISIERNE